jgi:hypothetical protein
MMKKKAQGLSINAVILIVLGLAVLVVLALGFMLGWNRIIPWLGEKNNVDTIAKSCETACGSENAYNYCSVGRELSDGKVTYKDVTCYTLSIATPFSEYGIDSCSNIDCKSMVKCSTWKYIDTDGKTSIPLKDKPEYFSSGLYTDYCDNTAP